MIRYILLADDDPDDRFFFNRAVSELSREVRLEMVKDGEQLMLWLFEHAEDLPDVIFLDLNMPRRNGFSCLDEIRVSRQLRHLFVAIYSTSTSPVDIAEAYEKGANIFINKPNGFDDLKTIISKVLAIDLGEHSTPILNENFVIV